MEPWNPKPAREDKAKIRAELSAQIDAFFKNGGTPTIAEPPAEFPAPLPKRIIYPKREQQKEKQISKIRNRTPEQIAAVIRRKKSILKLITRYSGKLNNVDITNKTSIPKSCVERLVSALISEDLVTRSSQRGRKLTRTTTSETKGN